MYVIYFCSNIFVANTLQLSNLNNEKIVHMLVNFNACYMPYNTQITYRYIKLSNRDQSKEPANVYFIALLHSSTSMHIK